MSTHHRKVFLGFGACLSNPPFPPWFVKRLFYPPVSHSRGKADFAPYNLRKVEACLLEKGGFRESEVATVHPQRLSRVVGSETRVVGVTVMDPLGLGPTSLTFASLFRGETATCREFRRLMAQEPLASRRLPVVVGGMGAWQLYYTPGAREKYGISTLVLGEGEKVVPELFAKAVEGAPLPPVIFGEDAEVEAIPTIRKPAVGGLVEVARGCGRNCQFCSPTLRGRRDMALGQIVAEARLNVEGGCPRLCLHAEDVLGYGSDGWSRFKPNREKVLGLFRRLAAEVGAHRLGVSHVTLSSIAADPGLVEEVSQLLQVGPGAPLFGYQTGIETGSVRLIRRLMAGKPLPFKPEEWPEVVVQGFGVSKDCSWVPAATLIMGLPGEREEDVNASLDLLDGLRDCPSFVIPQFFMPITETLLEKAPRFDVEAMGEAHGLLLLRCLEHSVRWADHLRQRLFQRDAPWLRLGYWLGYRLLYFFAWLGGKKIAGRLGLNWRRLQAAGLPRESGIQPSGD
ncbi:radical SAM protein [Candidatus Hecatella orcuttiae]|jgi:radical SAM superfamily enzyme YgiQ (UPF0313 family)|uniref:B12-binding domain-containing radical SAM protein n=1 Tax=Candidatus Hecatella orcuttiae TaxID=1935119 RepID=UPI002867F433|nr:radical SAM protein [Candidatus Hecatella orcuttiae]